MTASSSRERRSRERHAGAPPARAGVEAGNADVIAAHGRHFLIADDSGQRHAAVPRGRQLDAVVGDRVRATATSADQMVIEQIVARRNVIRRSDRFRSKSIAANVDRALVVVSGEPRFDEALLIRVLIAAGAEGVEIGLIATKQDLQPAAAAIEDRLVAHEAIGYPVWRVAVNQTVAEDSREARDFERLTATLANSRSLLLGQSGMGKSTLVNRLVPTAGQQTAAISHALNSGRHTTTDTRAFDLPGGGTLIDSPGFQTFEIEHLTHWEISHALPDFASRLGQCRFNDCLHLDEPGCVIRAACEAGGLDPLRYRLYQDLIARRG